MTPAVVDMGVPPWRLAVYMADFHGGGVERLTLMLIENFVARGLDVTVVANHASGDLQSLLPAKVRLVSLNAGRSLVALPALARYIRREQPDTLLSSMGHSNIVALWARTLARLSSGTRTRVVVCQHNALSMEARSMSTWQYRALPLLYRVFGRSADAIVGVSEGVSDDLARSTGLPRSRIQTIYNPVVHAQFSTAVTANADHRWFDDPELEIVIGIGRLVPQKDFATLLEAFARLQRPRARLLILGEGPERAALEQRTATLGLGDRVDLPGFALNPLPLLARARVMVLSSRYEGFGNVLVEALAAGAPVVSTRCPFGPDEILDDGRYGDLVPVGDVAAMAAAIDRQIRTPRPSLAERQRRALDFHLDQASDRYFALLQPPRITHRRPSTAQDGDKKHIAIYVPDLHLGGAEMSMARLAEGFAERGHQVTLLLHNRLREKIAVPSGVQLVDLGASRSMQAVRRLTSALRVHRPDILLSGLPHSNLVALAARWLARVECRVVLSEHAPLTRQVRQIGGWRYRVVPWLARRAYPRADAVVAVSGGVRDDLQRLMPSIAPEVIYNPVLPRDWERRAAQEVHDDWLDDPSLDVVLSVSRLSCEKDVPTLVAAFAKLAALRPNARLVIAGEGPERAAVAQAIAASGLQDRARLVGLIANPLAWMKRARVFALTSTFEGFGNVLVEALSVGTQVVSTDCPVGPREILDGGRLGTLVPVGDVDALAEAILKALEQRTVERQGQPQALQIHTQAYSQDHACENYLALFSRLARA